MKKNILYITALYCLLLAGCSSDEEIFQPHDTVPVTSALALQVKESGYRNTAATRSSEEKSEEELVTRFTGGDRLGLIIETAGSVEHVVYTYNGSQWTSSASLYYDPDATYTAYYPYRSEFDGKTPDEVSAAFSPMQDQSDYATGYAASDFMMCRNVAWNTGQKALQINLEHQYSLLRMPLQLPMTVTCGGEQYQFTISATDVAFHIGGQPYRAWIDGDGYARLILKSTATQTEVKAAYTYTCMDETSRGEYSATTLMLQSGMYHDLSSPLIKDFGVYARTRTGDYYIASEYDGNPYYLIPGEVTDIKEAKDNCIGVVLKAGRDTEGNWADNGTYTLKNNTTSMSEIHGYVLALRDANGGCQWGSFGTVVGCDRNQTTGFNGYSNTQIIVAKAQGGNLQDAFPAAYHAAIGYEAQYPAPANTSGWFLPSGGQCQYWLNHREVIFRSIQNAGGDGWKDWYWSSSESSYDPAGSAYYLSMRYGYMYYDFKYDGRAVRACLAF